MLETLEKIFDWTLQYSGYVSLVISTILALIGIVLFFRKIIPVLYRLGRALVGRKIAIFGNASSTDSLLNLLTDSSIFETKNIIKINLANDISRAKSQNCSVFLVCWSDFEDNFDAVLSEMEDSIALIVYAPPGSIKPEIMTQINNYRNAIVVNFRGRLLNDLMVSLITSKV